MLLAINCNNTNIKFGVVDGERIVGEWRSHTSAMRTADEHAVWLIQLMKMEGIDPKSITDAIIGSVVPNANFNLRRLCTRYFNTEPMFIGDANVKHGIVIRGVGAGADRICNTVGASLMFPKTPVVVVDFGTATNFDVVDEEGAYCGGAIAPDGCGPCSGPCRPGGPRTPTARQVSPRRSRSVGIGSGSCVPCTGTPAWCSPAWSST